MARSHVARYRARRVPAGQLAGRLARVAAASAAAAAAAVLPLLPGQALAGPGAREQPLGPLALTVTSMSPSYAEAGHTLVITGQVRNVSGSAVSGLSVGLQSSATGFTTRSELWSYAREGYLPFTRPVSTTVPVTRGRLAAGGTWSWVARVPASALPMSCFGVYPLTVQVSDAIALDVASAPIPLPYWPHQGACVGLPRPAPFPISWIWPLIDNPYQGPCPGLLPNDLAASVEPGGRLGGLLAAGSRYAASAGLNWAIDPALLDSVRTITSQYAVGGWARCTRETVRPASRYAAGWLSQLARATAGRSVFLTPYADVDVASMYRGDADLTRAFEDGQRVASQVLRADPASSGGRGGNWTPAAVAWPADGIANNAVLDNLAVLMKVSTVVLAMPGNSAVRYTPGAVTSQLLPTGTNLHILLADATLSDLLAQPGATSRQRGPIFAVSQLYLAETAMIAAEAPGAVRPIVVMPPRHWNPAARLANALLADTAAAKWLRPSTIGQLVRMRPEHVYGSLPQQVSPAELPRLLLPEVARLDRKIALLESIRVYPDPQLYRAVFGIESSAWRGTMTGHARALLSQTELYVADQFKGLTISAARHVTLGGKVSNGVPVSIRNGLSYPVQVMLRVVSSNRSIIVENKSLKSPIVVDKGKVAELKLTVRAAQTGAGATLHLSLWSANGQPLHVRTATMRISATDFGTVALIICAAALAVFVFASAARAIRHGRPEPGPPAEPAEPPVLAHGPSAELRDRQDQPDNVVLDRSDLTPAGPAMTDQMPTSPGSRTEERR